MSGATTILLVEDNDGDALILEELFDDGHVDGPVELIRATSIADALRALTEGADPVCALVDLGLPDAIGTDAVEALSAAAPELPIVVLTGSDDPELARDALRAGAQDYLVKGTELDEEVTRRAVRYAVDRASTLRALHASRRELRDFAHRVAHDLKSPMSVVLGSLDLLQHSRPDDENAELYDMLGRIHDEDPRDRTIAMLSKRYSIDQGHADRVQATALGLLGQVAQDWHLRSVDSAHALAWAAQLHEIGLAVNYTGHHKHGAYLIASSDLPGFSRDEQGLVATLVRGHRRKLDDSFFEDLPLELRMTGMRLCALLRLAVLLNRNRDPDVVSLPHLSANGNKVKLTFTEGWLDAHPLARADLEREQRLIKQSGLKLTGFEEE